MAQTVKNLPITLETRVQSLNWEDPLEEYSCLDNPMDRGAWWATVHGITESDMTEQLKMSIRAGEIKGGRSKETPQQQNQRSAASRPQSGKGISTRRQSVKKRLLDPGAQPQPCSQLKPPARSSETPALGHARQGSPQHPWQKPEHCCSSEICSGCEEGTANLPEDGPHPPPRTHAVWQPSLSFTTLGSGRYSQCFAAFALQRVGDLFFLGWRTDFFLFSYSGPNRVGWGRQSHKAS